MAIKPRKALQRWKGPVTDMQKILSNKDHPDYEDTISLTKQSLTPETMIYNIIKMARNGVIDHVNQYEARYGDATALDLQEAMALVKETNNWFMKLPVEIRNHFQNDQVAAVEFLDKVALGDPETVEKAKALGMVEQYEGQNEELKAKSEPEPTPPPPPPE